MSYRKLSIDDVTEIISRWRRAESARQIARETGLDRKTVRRYLTAAAATALSREREPTSQELAQVVERVQARPRPERSETWKQLLPYKERIAAAIHGQSPVRLRGVHRRLQGEGVSVTYWMLRRFALQMQGEPCVDGAMAAGAQAAREAVLEAMGGPPVQGGPASQRSQPAS